MYAYRTPIILVLQHLDKAFTCKQFVIQQDRCAMKVGTDGVLLGAWASVEQEPITILDIGAGTGLISLMLAQRSSFSEIEALEIETDAYEQCVENFENSPWADRVFCYHAGLDEFVEELEDTYDLIVSNPPFYTTTVASKEASRDTARQNRSMPFNELIQSVAELLNKEGVFAVIIPFSEEISFIALAETYALFPKRITRVRGNATAPIKRSLLEFHRKKFAIQENELTIEIERHTYTKAYIDLTKDFYLKM